MRAVHDLFFYSADLPAASKSLQAAPLSRTMGFAKSLDNLLILQSDCSKCGDQRKYLSCQFPCEIQPVENTGHFTHIGRAADLLLGDGSNHNIIADSLHVCLQVILFV